MSGRTFGRRVESIHYVHDDGHPYVHRFGKGAHLVAEPDGSVSIKNTRGKSWDTFLQRDGSEKKYLVNARGRKVKRNPRGLTPARYIVTAPIDRVNGLWEPRQRWVVGKLSDARRIMGRLEKGATIHRQRGTPGSQPMELLETKNPKGVKVARRRKVARKSASKGRAGGVPAWVRAKGFSSWAAYMESIRGGKKMARRRRKAAKRSGVRRVRRRRRRNPVALVASPRRRRRSVARVVSRRRRRRNPFGSAGGGIVKQITGIVVQGVKDGAIGTAALAGARIVRGRFANMEGNTPVGIGVEAAVGVVQALVLRRVFGADVARAAMQGVTQGIITTVVKGANIPVLSPGLGDEGELSLLSGIYDLSGVYQLQGDELPLLSGEASDGSGISGDLAAEGMM